MLENNDSSLNTGARDELRLRVLRALEGNPELSQRQLAAELGVSLGGVNYALKALVDRGFVKADNFRKSGNKGGLLVRVNPARGRRKGVACDRFFGRKLEEYEVLRQEIEALKGEVGSGDSGKGAKS